MTITQTKTSHPPWDERRYWLPAVPPALITFVIHSVLTIISLSDNVENTVQTTKRGTMN